MEVEVGKTAKYLREKQGVPEHIKEELKEFNRIKREITNALQNEELTIAQLSEKLQMSTYDVTYYLMSLVKYGIVATGEIDDMDEYYSYKLVK
ncbi:MAG: ArsR family transcriptional regulator [Bacteroidia bacterium]|nr:ArsR family transcriptional regulator [Bacteroidia bacterium]